LTISANDAARLRQAGFLESEIEGFANAVTSDGKPQPPVDLDSPVWQAVLESRREWWVDKIDRGWTEHEIINELQNYYRRDAKRNPWDFIRAEYKPPKRKDYMEIARARAASQISSELEGYKL
jgi:hypothetical protein